MTDRINYIVVTFKEPKRTDDEILDCTQKAKDSIAEVPPWRE